ncbi:hypothetical protein GJAV_G00236990 [Gymnothorax javanicus]|nr:hypothetical protein GJAV_G00236990 [Gymnothorax javanicus]
MVSWIISRAVVLVFGTLYPAYYSYKAVKSKNVKEYVRWMMYWIVFALYTVVETITDLSLSWFPLYYEMKISFVVWLLSPYTRGASLIYRKFLHPLLSAKERDIDEYIVQAKKHGYETMVNFGKQSLSIAATAAVTAAVKGQGAISERLKNLNVQDLSQIPAHDATDQPFPAFTNPGRRALNPSSSSEYYAHEQELEGGPGDEAEGTFSEDEAVTQRGVRRSQSVRMTRARVRKDSRYGSLKLKPKRRPALNTMTYEP